MTKTGTRELGTGNSTSGSGEFEATLRLIAHLPAPSGLEERVQAGLRAASCAPPHRARILPWPVARGWMQSSLARSAAAAAIAAVAAGVGWGVYARVQPPHPAQAITISPRPAVQGGFSSAGAMRTPQTLNGPIIAPPAVPPSETSAPPTAKAGLQPAHRKLPRRAKPASKAGLPSSVGSPAGDAPSTLSPTPR